MVNNPRRWPWLVLICCGWLLPFQAVPAFAVDIPIRSIAQLTVDDDGRFLSYPSAVFYDAVEEEIYLVNGGTGRVVVYGPDYFPGISMGAGRGVEAPRGGVVLENGQVYLLQVRNVKSERPRITILNGAFFVEREIYLDEIPEAAEVVPRELAISRDGLIYLAGSSSRGVLVLDTEGNFLRRLRPRDRTVVAVEEDEFDTLTAIAETEASEAQRAAEVTMALADIPEEYRPRGGRLAQGSESRDDLSPVRINHVTIDSSGRIYLLSAETSKIYVYGPDEIFLFSFGEKGGTPRRLSQPRALAIDEERGLIYVADYMRHSILAYNMRGEYRFEFGGRGVGPGWFNFPEDMTITKDGRLIISDLFNRRVQVLEVVYEEFSPTQKAQIEGVATPQPRLRSSPPPSAEVHGAEPTPATDSLPEEAEIPQVIDAAAGALRESQIEEIIINDP